MCRMDKQNKVWLELRSEGLCRGPEATGGGSHRHARPFRDHRTQKCAACCTSGCSTRARVAKRIVAYGPRTTASTCHPGQCRRGAAGCTRDGGTAG